MPATLQLALLIAILLPAGKIVASICTRFGIPAILGELMVGVVAGPGCFNMLHMHLFSGTPAADAFLLLAQIGGFVLMFIAGLETDIDRMREASGTAFLVALSGVIWPFFLGAGCGASSWASMEQRPFSRRRTDGNERIHFRANPDGRGKDDLARSIRDSGAAVIDDVMGLFVLAFLAASCSTTGSSSFGLAPMLSKLASTTRSNGSPASPYRPNDSDRNLCDDVLCGFLRCGATLDRSADASVSHS